MKKRICLVMLSLLLFVSSGISAFAAAPSGQIISCSLSPTSVTMNENTTKSLKVGYSYYGTVTPTFKWSSSNTKVATVSNGIVKAVKAGKATITVDVNGKKATCAVTVNAVKPKWVGTGDCLKLLNNYRKAYNKGKKKAKQIGMLSRDKTLEDIAKIRAKEIATTGKFSHTRPNGKSGLTLIKGNKAKGENIAMGQKTCAEVSKALYASKSHRDNMLRKNFKKVGIACYYYKGVHYWVYMFSS